MLLSVSVWSGADAGDAQHVPLDLGADRLAGADLFRPRVLLASAWRALRHGRTNMDVPISIGVLLAFGLSLYETIHHGAHAYFDAAISLLFFLLIGRTLDHMMRERARTAVARPGAARRRAARSCVHADGSTRLSAGRRDRAGHDDPACRGRARAGRRASSTQDAPSSTARWCPARACRSRSRRARCCPGRHAEPHRPADHRRDGRRRRISFLAEMVRMMEAAEGGRSRLPAASPTAPRGSIRRSSISPPC